MSKITDDPIKYDAHIRRLKKQLAEVRARHYRSLELLDELEAQVDMCVGHPTMWEKIFDTSDEG